MNRRQTVAANARHAVPKYVSLANDGRNGPWLIVLGFLLANAVWMVATYAAAAGAGIAIAIADPDAVRSADFVDSLLAGRTGAFVLAGSVGALWIGVWLSLRYVHRRAFATVLGADMHINRLDVMRGLFAALLVNVGLFTVGVLIDGIPSRGSVSLGEWLLWLAPMLGLLLLQTSAEEIAFRGYLTQAMAQRFRSPAIWAGVPIAIFTLLHWHGAASASINVAALVVVAALSVSMTFLVYLTGNLSASIGIYWGNNVAAFLLFSNAPGMGEIALFQHAPLTDPSLTTNHAVQLAAVGVFGVLATLWLLVRSSSPLRLRSLQHS
jgi:membrane protease YdiL (CAAX protease family)